MKHLFSKERLRKLIFPLVIEQILAVTVGMADTIMVASCGEAAVSGISIVDSISVLIIGLFGALATGGAVVAAQYIGKKDRNNAALAGNQLIIVAGGIAVGFMLLALLANEWILHLIYGRLDAEVMQNARIYFYIVALSYPFLAVFSSSAALFRASGNSKISMQVAFFTNALNIAGNALLIYVFHLGVMGAAISTLVSRVVSAVILTYFLTLPNSPLPVVIKFKLNVSLIKNILHVGVPNGIENSVFQLGKLLLSSLVAGFGTMAITANAVASTVCGLETIPASAIGMAMLTVVGQCVGAGQLDEAKKYMLRLMRTAYIYLFFLNVAIILLLTPITSLFNLSPQTAELAKLLMFYHSVCCILVYPPAFPLANGLRAANDAKFTMVVSIACMWICRIVLAYILARGFGLGLFGVWIAMTVDWAVRALVFTVRLLGGKWRKKAMMKL